MSTFTHRGSIALSAVVVGLICSRPAEAQVGVVPGSPQPRESLWNNLVSGSEIEIVNQAVAAKRLLRAQARLSRDSARGDSAAVARNVELIHDLRYRIVVDEWLIRKNTLCTPGYSGYYPYPRRMDPMSCAAIAQYHRPAILP